MKTILNRLVKHERLSYDEARSTLTGIGTGKYNSSQIASFLTTYMLRPVTVEEFSGFRDALFDLCVKVDLSEFETIDMCGTGGDGKNTFNISTLASFVVAGAGVKVAKHGNYAISSASGSSNMLEYFGYKFSNDEDTLKKELGKAGICFLHAPLFHPAMKNVGPIRKELGVKTFFNMLGPLVNPSSPQYQMTGVFNLEAARLYHYIFQQTAKKYAVIFSMDGYDEVSLTSRFKMITNSGEYIFEPESLNFSKLQEKDLYGGSSIEEAAGIFSSILEGNGTSAQNDVVVANAGIGLSLAFPEKTKEECFEMARKSLFDGKALKVLKTLCN